MIVVISGDHVATDAGLRERLPIDAWTLTSRLRHQPTTALSSSARESHSHRRRDAPTGCGAASLGSPDCRSRRRCLGPIRASCTQVVRCRLAALPVRQLGEVEHLARVDHMRATPVGSSRESAGTRGGGRIVRVRGSSAPGTRRGCRSRPGSRSRQRQLGADQDRRSQRLIPQRPGYGAGHHRLQIAMPCVCVRISPRVLCRLDDSRTNSTTRLSPPAYSRRCRWLRSGFRSRSIQDGGMNSGRWSPAIRTSQSP
jgi:hypothetical protein